MTLLSPAALDVARAHALQAYPDEACGLVVDGAYVPQFNYAADPANEFEIHAEVFRALAEQGRTVQAVVHSHPDGHAHPSARDMQGQVDTDLPWVILATDGERVADPIMWGDALPIPPMLARTFVHGVTDCYSLIRDAYRLGTEGLDAQGITGWPYPPTVLPEFPRADNWWTPDAGGANLYLEGFTRAGFRPVALSEVRAGDVFLCKIRASVPNHGGVYVGNDLILHHLPGRPSRREPVGIWMRAVELWLRHETGDRMDSTVNGVDA